jgi:hypothetical protein
MENLHVNLQESPVSIAETHVVLQRPSKGNKLRCDFIPRKSLEEVLDYLKDKRLVVPNPEPIRIDELEITKHGRRKIQRSPDIDFKIKRPGQLISRTLRNRQRDHEKPIPVIEVDDQFYEDDIEDRIAEDDIDD